MLYKCYKVINDIQISLKYIDEFAYHQWLLLYHNLNNIITVLIKSPLRAIQMHGVYVLKSVY